MSLLTFSMKHGRTQAEAQAELERVVADVQTKFGSLLTGIEWSPDRNSVCLRGPGVQVDIRVDSQDIHVKGDVPLIGKLMGAPLLTGLKNMVQERFKQLPAPGSSTSNTGAKG